MPLTPGTRLGPYEIVALLGSGGMGEVYRARDTRLDRIVAIKRLTAHSERFEQEARAIAALNHPRLPSARVRRRLPMKGPMSAEEALRLALQIVSAIRSGA